jgi:rhodanese-related sulfurtransferase
MKTALFAFCFVGLIAACNSQSKPGATKQDLAYVCLPCGSACDTIGFKKAGTCSHCHMKLVKKSTITHSDLAPEDLCSFIAQAATGSILLLDVRTEDEFEGKSMEKFGRLTGAVNIPVQELEQRMSELAAYKNKPVVVYCSHSHRSPRASYMLSQNGFNKVTNMLGGMSVWRVSVKDDACNQKLFINQ